MADDQPAVQPFQWGRISSAVTFLLAFGALIAVFLYAFGMAARETYLIELGLSPSFFEGTREWNVFFGYNLLLKYTLVGYLKLLFPALLFLSAIAFLAGLQELIVKKKKNSQTFLQWLKATLRPLIDENASSRQRLLFCILYATIAPIAILVFFSVILVALSIPTFLGENAGKSEALVQLKKLEAKDAQAGGLLSIRKDDKILMEGYALVSGESHAAFYNPKTKTIHTFHMDGIELVHPLPTVAKPSSPADKPTP